MNERNSEDQGSSSGGFDRRAFLRATVGVGVAPLTVVENAQAQELTGGGDLEWEFEADNDIKASPTVVDGTVYVGVWDERVYAVDATSGDRRWSVDTGDSVYASPTVVDGVVFVTNLDGTVFALNAATGDEYWSVDSGQEVLSSPTVVDGTVFVARYDGVLLALTAEAGEMVWEFDTEGSIWSAPTVAGGNVYVGNRDYRVIAIDAASGDLEWVFATDFNVVSSPTVVGDAVYATSDDGNVYALDADTGDERWSFGIQNPNDFSSSPTVRDGTVYAGSDDDSLYALDAATGEKQWEFTAGASVNSSPTVAEDTVFVGSNDDSVYAVDAETGERQWSFDTNDDVESSPTVYDGTVYVGSDDGNLYAIEAGVDGHSDGSRVLLGTLGHHGDWQYADQSLDLDGSGTDGRPVIDTRSLDLSAFAIESGTDHPDVEVRVADADSVAVEVGFRDDPIALEGNGERWSGTIPAPSEPLPPGTWVDLTVRARNGAGESTLDRISTDVLSVDAELFSAEDLALPRETDQLGYAVFDEVLTVAMAPLRFPDRNEPLPEREGAARRKYETYRYWKLAHRIDLAAYFGSQRGALGEFGIDLTIGDNGERFYQVPRNYDTYRGMEPGFFSGGNGIESLVSDAEEVLPDRITDGPYDIWGVTHEAPSVATPEDADPDEDDTTPGLVDYDGWMYVTTIFGSPSDLDTWYHELCHVYGLEHLYEYGNVTNECTMGEDTREAGDPVPAVPPVSSPIRMADTLGLDTTDRLPSNDEVSNWLSVGEEYAVEEDFGSDDGQTIDLSYLTDYERGDAVEVVTFAGITYVLEARRYLDGYEDGGPVWTPDGRSVVVYRHSPDGILSDTSVELLETDGQRALSSSDDVLLDPVGRRVPYRVAFGLESIDEDGATVTVELTLPNSRGIVLEDDPTFSWEVPHNELSYTPPTLSLTVRDDEGRVAGYSDGEYLAEIPEGTVSGPRVGGPEWVVVPSSAEVDVEVSAVNLERFADEMADEGLYDAVPEATREDVSAEYRLGVTAYPEDAILTERDGELIVPGAETRLAEGRVDPGAQERAVAADDLPDPSGDGVVFEGEGDLPDWLPLAGAGAGAVGLGSGAYWYLSRGDGDESED